MSLSNKKIVEAFYTSDFLDPDLVKTYLHPEAELFWNSSEGFRKMDFSAIVDFSTEMSKSYESLRAEISHLLQDKNQVTIRFTHFTRTVENPEEEIPVAHFMAIWEIKDAKLFKGYQISQPVDGNPDNLNTFL